jgi:hypothetical protein
MVESHDKVHQPIDWIDLWHVAVALEIRADVFVTFDKDQFVVAQMEHGSTPA